MLNPHLQTLLIVHAPECCCKAVAAADMAIKGCHQSHQAQQRRNGSKYLATMPESQYINSSEV